MFCIRLSGLVEFYLELVLINLPYERRDPVCRKFAQVHPVLVREKNFKFAVIVLLRCQMNDILGFKQQGSFNKLRVFLFLIAWYY